MVAAASKGRGIGRGNFYCVVSPSRYGRLLTTMVSGNVPACSQNITKANRLPMPLLPVFLNYYGTYVLSF